MAPSTLPVDPESQTPSEIRQPEPAQTRQDGRRRGDTLVVLGMWLISLSVLLTAGYLFWKQQAAAAAPPPSAVVQAVVQPTLPPALANISMPDFSTENTQQSLVRYSTLHTVIPSRPRETAIDYTVVPGDSVFSISKDFNLKPESVLWANYDQLQDSPDSLAPGMILKIPPVNGVYYKWKEGDTLASVATEFKAKAEDIVNFTGNNLDLADPKITAGELVMIPGGSRKFQTWIVPVIARGNAGVSKSVLGPGACTGSYTGAYGGGGFIWPSANHFLSGNDFWSGHLGIDIAGATGDLVWAADAGVVVFAGWSTGGYGNMVMIDHGNGYQSVYGHLSAVLVSCGQSVYAGNLIGNIGSTGNSTGSHLHFEIRYFGQFVNPWQVLP